MFPAFSALNRRAFRLTGAVAAVPCPILAAAMSYTQTVPAGAGHGTGADSGLGKPRAVAESDAIRPFHVDVSEEALFVNESRGVSFAPLIVVQPHPH